MSVIDWCKVNINQTWFNWIASFGAVSLVWFLIDSGHVQLASTIGQFGGMFTQFVFYTCAVFGFQFFQLGTGRDIQAEIYDQNNLAAAVYQGFLVLGFAVVIAKAML